MAKETKADKIFNEIDKAYQKAITVCDKIWKDGTNANGACVKGAFVATVSLDKDKLARIK